MKRWKIEYLKHHNRVVSVIEENQRDGWSLHTYSTAGLVEGAYHYLKENNRVPKNYLSPSCAHGWFRGDFYEKKYTETMQLIINLGRKWSHFLVNYITSITSA